jgi:hypothetical protein
LIVVAGVVLAVSVRVFSVSRSLNTTTPMAIKPPAIGQ